MKLLKRLKSGLSGLFAQGNLGQATKYLIFATLLLAGWAIAVGSSGAAIGFIMIGGIAAIVSELFATGGKATH